MAVPPEGRSFASHEPEHAGEEECSSEIPVAEIAEAAGLQEGSLLVGDQLVHNRLLVHHQGRRHDSQMSLAQPLETAKAGLLRARWTDAIHDEWMENLPRNTPPLTRDRLAKRRNAMDAVIRDA